MDLKPRSLVAKIRHAITLSKGIVRGLSEESAGDDPIALFGEWFADARRAGLYLPEAMSVATATKEGVPSARMMLLKGFDSRGFVFYTNFESKKSRDLAENPRAAMVFHWGTLQRQVRIQGTVERLTTEESESYFRTRPRGSQLGAWASNQSAELESRQVLELRYREHEQKFKGRDVPLPPFWGGFRLEPTRIEFWQGRLNRLHDRLCYTHEGSGWRRVRLYP